MHQQLEEDCRFYVTCRDAGRTGFLLGPFETHAAALARVEDGRKMAGIVNSWSCFYAFVPARLPASKRVKTVFGR